jgi:phosphoribosyl-ATP pyrophosphohydrolase/phosphoribosyl-AMP cyclohydrolase
MLKYNDKGLIPVIVQDADNGEVLMLAYADKESLKRTVDSGEVWFYSRSRQELWHKGATSGSILKVKSIAKDCDSDTILIRAEPAGPACHTGNRSCFFQKLEKKDID